MDTNNGATNKISFDKDFSLETRFSRTIKAILGNFFIQKDVEKDIHEGTDFLIFTVMPFKVAVRLRRYPYFLRYPNEFTVRYSRPSGVKTELQKINEGLVDYMLYGFVNQEEKKIVQYFIADLSVFLTVNLKPNSIHPNNPPDSELAAYSLNRFPKEFIKKLWKNPHE